MARFPCGFCGGAACTVAIKGGGAGTAHSTCPQAYAFKIGSAKEFSEKRPCTNVPVACPLHCGETHWKYNYQAHLEDRHPSWALTMGAGLQDFRARIEISASEQMALGVTRERVRVWPPVSSATCIPYASTSIQPPDKENIAPLRLS